MAINREALRVDTELALMIDKRLSGDLLHLVTAWSRAWKVVETEWRAVTVQLAQEVAANGVPKKSTLRRSRTILAALNSTRAELTKLQELSGGRATASAHALIQSSVRSQSRLIAAQLPKGSDLREAVERAPDLPNRQLEALVRRTTQQIESQLRPLSDDAAEVMRTELVRGAARGSNPREMAARMLQQVRDGFDGGLARALNISRTEALEGHRTAAMASQSRFSDVLEDWQWLAHLGKRTCPACWSKHGTRHPLTEPGPEGHQQCRCSRAPVTKTWRELGFDIDEPPSAVRDGRQEFDKLPRSEQLQVMGPTRLQGLEQGKILWDELAVKRSNPGWRDGYYAAPVRDFRKRLYVAG